MKAFGHELSKYDSDADTLLELGEVSLEGTADELRQVAKFLEECAAELDRGSEQDHWHYNSNINDRPQVVICRPFEGENA